MGKSVCRNRTTRPASWHARLPDLAPAPRPRSRPRPPGDGHGAALAELLELDAGVLPLTPRIVGRVAQVLAGPPARVVDLGAGAGTGALELASAFPDAQVVAVDRSAAVVHRLREVLGAAGLGPRAQVVHAEVDAIWASSEPVGLVWACAVLREVTDPGGAMVAVRSALRPPSRGGSRTRLSAGDLEVLDALLAGDGPHAPATWSDLSGSGCPRPLDRPTALTGRSTSTPGGSSSAVDRQPVVDEGASQP